MWGMGRGAAASQPLLSTYEAAAFLRRSARTLQGWRRDGVGPRFIRASGAGRGSVLYDPADLLAWVASHKVDPEVAL